MPTPQQISKIEGIYEITASKLKTSHYYTVGAILMLSIMLFSGIIFSTVEQNKGPIWQLPAISQFAELGVTLSPLAAVLLIFKSKKLSYEKKNFVNAYKAYKLLARYNSLKDCAAQLPSDIEKAKKYLEKVASSFCDRSGGMPISDIRRELDLLYENIGKLVQTRIVNRLNGKEGLPKMEEYAFNIAETLADNSFNRLQVLQKNLLLLEPSDSIESKSSFLSSHIKLYKALLYVGKLAVSILSVTIVALILSSILQRNISEFGPYILASSFVLFVAWVFKTR
jgi:hypothetical protein